MEIVMLGHSAAGKSSYMALMYELMHRGVNGFSVSAARDQVHHQLLRDARAIRRGSYPDATDRRHQYALRLRHRRSTVVDFVWKDYRGAALTEFSTSEQKAQLHADLRTADGIVLFVDLPELLVEERSRRKVRFLTVLVADALEDRSRPTPLVIACTKSDLVAPSMDPAPFVTALTPITDAVAASFHVHSTVVELSCGPRPSGIAVPVLFSLAFGIVARVQQLREAHAATLERVRTAASYDTFWDRLSSAFKDEPSWLSIAADRQAEADRELRALETLIEPGRELLAEINDLPRF
jgi:hypothetical protein